MDNSKTRILIVDDNEVVSLASKRIINREFGIESQMASDGLEALEKFKKEYGYSVIVIDVLMPKMNGFELADKIREYCAHIEVDPPYMIVCTILDDENFREEVIQHGIDDYVNKGEKGGLVRAIKKWQDFRELKRSIK